MRFPKVVKVRQDFPRPRVDDVGEALREQCAKEEIRGRIEPGAEVAITAGSRGVAGIDDVLRSLVRILKEAGASPFIVPSMGSHGGATAEGQVIGLRRPWAAGDLVTLDLELPATATPSDRQPRAVNVDGKG